MKPIQFTRAGYEEVQKKLDELMKKRPLAVSELQRSRELGDLSENGAYKAARHELSSLDSRIRHQRILLRFGKVTETKFDGTVAIGCRVKLQEGKNISEFLIVGAHESDIKEGKLSHLSPLGAALIGKQKGEEINFQAPSGIKKYLLLDVANA